MTLVVLSTGFIRCATLSLLTLIWVGTLTLVLLFGTLISLILPIVLDFLRKWPILSIFLWGFRLRMTPLTFPSMRQNGLPLLISCSFLTIWEISPHTMSLRTTDSPLIMLLFRHASESFLQKLN